MIDEREGQPREPGPHDVARQLLEAVAELRDGAHRARGLLFYVAFLLGVLAGGLVGAVVTALLVVAVRLGS